MKKVHLLFAFFLFFLCAGPSVYAVVPVNSTAVQQQQADAALQEFQQTSKAEKKQRLKEAKKQLKYFKTQKKKGMEADEQTILLVILAILLPPLAVYLHQNAFNSKFIISLILTLLFWIPGVIYSLLVVLGVI